MYFSVEILWDKYAIGIYFKISDKKPNETITWKKEPNIQNFLKLSNGMTIESLFIQKDIKGFESELGYFSLNELNEIRGNLGLKVEIDSSFTPISLASVRKMK